MPLAEHLRLPKCRIPSAQARQRGLAGPHWNIKKLGNEKGDDSRRFGNGCSIRVAFGQLEIPPLVANSNVSLDAVASASRHELLNGVALVVRNSHQIHMHLPLPGRAAHGERERCLAKECFGSDRIRKERSQLPAATMTSRIKSKNQPHQQQRIKETGDYANHYPYAATLEENTFFFSNLTDSYR
jgi:hypothetical protein